MSGRCKSCEFYDAVNPIPAEFRSEHGDAEFGFCDRQNFAGCMVRSFDCHGGQDCALIVSPDFTCGHFMEAKPCPY